MQISCTADYHLKAREKEREKIDRRGARESGDQREKEERKRSHISHTDTGTRGEREAWLVRRRREGEREKAGGGREASLAAKLANKSSRR